MTKRLRIVHVFRAPVGGLFRHVRDLARGQSALGHDVAILCDATSGGDAARQALAATEPFCRLGIHRIAMSRMPGFGDIAAARQAATLAGTLAPDVIHGHGAKGGFYARLAGRRLGARTFYTPHGGSLHYEWTSPAGLTFLSAERALLRSTSGLLFVCHYERQVFARKIGLGRTPNRVVHNGLWPEEFAPVEAQQGASDLLFIGELRALKGVSDLLAAIAHMSPVRRVSATIAGDGPDRASFEAEAARLGIAGQVVFTGAMPARQAFPLGRLFVMPSRAESFPYVVLETVAAGLPVIATAVGGIPEILPTSDLVPARDPQALSAAIAARLAEGTRGDAAAAQTRDLIRSRFTAAGMAAAITEFYG
ncbi:glycosyltransferase family 4 protein [soil metagenome]